MIGVNHAAALDMPISMSPQVMYEFAKEKVIQLDTGRGVLLLVDMGSLTSFGEILQEETGIIVKTIEMASTPMVIDACRKAVLGRDIHYIYDSLKIPAIHHFRERSQEQAGKKGIIITACFTGEGASERLKHIIEESLRMETIEIVALNIMNKKEFISKVEQLRERHKILAIASTIDIEIDEIPLITAAQVLAGVGIDKIRGILETENNYQKIAKSLNKHIKLDSEGLVENLRAVLAAMEQGLGLYIKEEVKIGIVLHMCFLLDKLKTGGKETFFEELQDFMKQYGKEFAIVRSCLKSIEAEYEIQIGEHEAAYICKMLLSNGDILQDIV
jgi:transcriptional regulatory protein LevR